MRYDFALGGDGGIAPFQSNTACCPLLTLATVWELLAGEIAARWTPPKIKKHGRGKKRIFGSGCRICVIVSTK